MSGHNKWSQIKHQKGAKDAKKSAIFTKILGAIAIAARANPKPDENPRLRTLIEKARSESVPNENIQRAITRAKEQKDLKEFIFECIGPEGIAIIVEGITDSSNRTIQQLRTLVQEVGAKPADPGSLLWAFAAPDGGEPRPGQGREIVPRFPQTIPDAARAKLTAIVDALNEHNDVQRVISNAD